VSGPDHGPAAATVPRGRQPAVTLADGVRLGSWSPSHVPELLTAFVDPLVRRYAGVLPQGRPDALDLLRRYTGLWATGEGVAWALLDGSGSVLGAVTFGLGDAELGTGSVGYWLSPHARGRGLASSAVRAGSRVVFERLGWHRIELRHAVENERSCAVARRCGYRLEGTLRDAMRYPVDGRWSDEHLHARLSTDVVPG
jgi:[ribosomal protein S5]-alanine N-acetyltransferase